MSALIVKNKQQKDVGCVRIVITFSFAKNATRTEIILKVFTLTPIKDIMFLPNCSDFFILYIVLIIFFKYYTSSYIFQILIEVLIENNYLSQKINQIN